jgi:hypothetical protein
MIRAVREKSKRQCTLRRAVTDSVRHFAGLKDRKLKIVTYNLRFGGTAAHCVQWDKVLREVDPDISQLQETRNPREFLAADFFRTHRHQIVRSSVPGRPRQELWRKRPFHQGVKRPTRGDWTSGGRSLPCRPNDDPDRAIQK